MTTHENIFSNPHLVGGLSKTTMGLSPQPKKPSVLQIPALLGKQTFPKRAVSRTTSHCTKEITVNLNDFLYGLRRNPLSGSCARVYSYDDALLELKCQSCRSVVKLYLYITLTIFGILLQKFTWLPDQQLDRYCAIN